MFLSKYGVARHIYIPIIKRAVIDFAVSADWTPTAGDVKISKDGGAFANVTNLPTAIASANTGAEWDFSLTATEMQAAQVVVIISDAATKAVEDQSFIIETYGNASAQHAMDFGTATIVASSVAALAANVITAASIAADAITAAKVADGTIDAATFAAGAITATVIATDAIDADALAADGTAEIAAAILDATVAEPAGIFTWPTSLRKILAHLGVLTRNKITQTSTTTLFRNDADNATLMTQTVSDDGTTFIDGELV